MRINTVLFFVFVLGACSKSAIDKKLDEAGKLRDRMCECTDADCAKSVHEDYIAWKKGNKNSDDKPSEDQMKRWESIHDEMMACRHKVETAAK